MNIDREPTSESERLIETMSAPKLQAMLNERQDDCVCITCMFMPCILFHTLVGHFFITPRGVHP